MKIQKVKKGATIALIPLGIILVVLILAAFGVFKSNGAKHQDDLGEHDQRIQNQPQTTNYSLGVGLSFGVTRNSQSPSPQQYPLGSRENPIHIERVVIDYGGLVSLQPSDSVWFSIDQQHIGQYGFQTKFSSLEGRFDLWRIGDKKYLTETPNKRIPDREVAGVTRFCLHNTGSGTVLLYAWYGRKSAQDIQALAGI